jgi:hypothetical protein
LGGAALTADLSSDLARYRRCRRGRDRPRHRVGQARRALHVLAWRLLPRHGRQGQGWHPQSGAHGLGTASRAGAGGQVRTRSGAVRGAQTAVASPHSPELVWGFPCQADSAWAFPARRAGSSFKTKPLVRRRAASALRRCVGAPLVPTHLNGTERKAWQMRRALARRERSHAQGRPFFTGGPSMASTHHLPRLSTVPPASPYREPYSHWKQAREQRTEGSPPSGAKDRAATLYSVGPTREPDHEAAIRFGGEAPRRRAHSNERLNDHVLARVTATSDRDRPAVQDSVCRARRNSVPAFLVVVSVRRVVAAQHRAGPRRW